MTKGTRTEREVQDIYQAAGWDTFSPPRTKYGDTDIFNLYDILAYKPFQIPRLIQVSTNPNGRKDWMEATLQDKEKGIIPEYAQKYDREGYRVMHPTKDGFETVLDERDTKANIGEIYTQWLD